MPTYEYECRHCHHRFEKFQSITAEPLKRCPKCRHGVSRLVGTGGGLIFKGSGFYATDYRSDGYKQAKKADGGGETKSAESVKSDKPVGAGAGGGEAKSAEPVKSDKKAGTGAKSAAKPS